MTTRLLLLAALVGSACVEGEPEVGSSSAEVAVTWTNLVRVSASGNDLTKTNPQESWNAGAVTVEALEGDGYVEFTTGESDTAKMVGLSVGDGGQGFADIDFAMFLRANGAVGVYEAGVERGNSLATYSAGDLFRIEANDGAVTYSVNGTVFYTSPTPPPVGLRVDTSLRSPGATVLDVDLVSTPLTWQNAVGVTLDADGTGLTRSAAGTTWSAGAATVETLSGDGFVEFTTAENDTAKMVGLSSGDTNQHWTDIDFAIYLKANGTIAIAEAGVQKSGFGTYLPGDSFRIEVQGGVVHYSVNGGPPFHTSTAAPAPVLLVDTSLSTPGATIQDVRLTAAANACPAYSGVGSVCVGSFVVINSIDLEEISGCSEITGNLTVSAPGMTVIALPKLERIAGILDVGQNTDLSRLRLPALKEVGGSLYMSLYQPTAGIDLSRLRGASSIAIGPAGSNQVAVNLGCLETTGSVYVNGLLRAHRLPSIAGDATAYPLDAPALTDVTGMFTYTGGTNVPALEHTGSVLLVEASTVSMPSLAVVDGKLTAGDVSAPESFCQSTTLTATSLELPALTRVGALHLCWPGLEELSLPELQLIDGPVVGRTALYIRSTSQTSPFELPALTEVEGPVSLFADTSLPVLERVSGPSLPGGEVIIGGPTEAPALLEVVNYGLDLRAPFSAPALTFVNRTVTLDGISSVSLPSLASAGGINASFTSSLTALDLPSLTTVTRTDVFIVGTSLVSLSLPALQGIANRLRINDNDSLTTLSLPALSELGSSLKVVGNDILPNCYATDLRDDLIAAGWIGSWTISGNGTGTCP